MGLPNGDLLLIRLGGDVAGDDWSIGFWFKITGQSSVPTPSQMNSAANALLGGFNTLFWSAATNPWKNRCSTGTTLKTSKSYYYRDGVLSAAGTSAITAVAGTGSSTQPNPVAQVITLLTDQPGRNKRGRVYMPATALPPTASTGLWGASAALVSNLASLFSTSSGAQSTGYFFGGSDVADLVVVSQGGQRPVVTAPVATSVTSLRMDNKPDTQRGRENKLVPTIFDTASIG
jgi:hypothetical protein